MSEIASLLTKKPSYMSDELLAERLAHFEGQFEKRDFATTLSAIDLTNPAEDPHYLHQGAHWTALQVVNQGEPVVVRMLRTEGGRVAADEFAYKTHAMIRAYNLPWLDQIVACSRANPEQPFIVSRPQQGENLDTLSTAELAAIPREYIVQLAATIALAHSVGVETEFHPDGWYYHPPQGFTCHDIEMPPEAANLRSPKATFDLLISELDRPEGGSAEEVLRAKVLDGYDKLSAQLFT